MSNNHSDNNDTLTKALQDANPELCYQLQIIAASFDALTAGNTILQLNKMAELTGDNLWATLAEMVDNAYPDE